MQGHCQRKFLLPLVPESLCCSVNDGALLATSSLCHPIVSSRATSRPAPLVDVTHGVVSMVLSLEPNHELPGPDLPPLIAL